MPGHGAVNVYVCEIRVHKTTGKKDIKTNDHAHTHAFRAWHNTVSVMAVCLKARNDVAWTCEE